VLAEELRHRFMEETVQCRVLRGFKCNSIWTAVIERDKNNGIGYDTKQQTFKEPIQLGAVFVLSERTFEFAVQEGN
jgi:hypothetical protein